MNGRGVTSLSKGIGYLGASPRVPAGVEVHPFFADSARCGGGAPPHLAPGGPFEPPAQLALPAPEGPATSEACVASSAHEGAGDMQELQGMWE